MDVLEVLALVLAGGGVIIAHEATHLGAARLVGPVTADITSWVPLRFTLRFQGESVSSTQLRVVAIAPALVGTLTAGMWVLIHGCTEPLIYPPCNAPSLGVLYLALYAHVSPADMRSFLNPDTE